MENLRDRLAVRLRELMDKTITLDTQVKVAKQSGVSQATVQRILTRQQAATVDVIERLADAFQIKPSERLLLDRQERELLSRWVGLSETNRAKVLGYIAAISSLDNTTDNPGE